MKSFSNIISNFANHCTCWLTLYHYDNYDAIEVPFTDAIPSDYDGVMGVPISFLDKYCPEQFEILGQMANTNIDEHNFGYPFVCGVRKYARILIRKIQ